MTRDRCSTLLESLDQLAALREGLGSAARTVGVRTVTEPHVAFTDDDSWCAAGYPGRRLPSRLRHRGRGDAAGAGPGGGRLDFSYLPLEHTARLVRMAASDRATAGGVPDAAAGLTWVFRERRPVAVELERRLRLLGDTSLSRISG